MHEQVAGNANTPQQLMAFNLPGRGRRISCYNQGVPDKKLAGGTRDNDE
jgi:hypothetical protein